MKKIPTKMKTKEKGSGDLEQILADKIGKKIYEFPKDIHVRKENQDIELIVDVNVEEYHILYEEPTWHSACFGRSLEAYLFFLHGYVQKQGGMVHLDLKFAHEIPQMERLFKYLGKKRKGPKDPNDLYERIDGEEYFLLIYRIRNMARLYSWIVLSDFVKSLVQELKDVLECERFFVKLADNYAQDENSLSQRIKDLFVDEVIHKNFAFWLFREDGKYRRTCIHLYEVADLWWLAEGNLTLVFFGMASFEKSLRKMLLFMGLCVDLFLVKQIEIIDVERSRLGLAKGEDVGEKIGKIQCILYDIAGVDVNYKEMFLLLNDNYFKDTIHFRYVEGVKLTKEKLYELRGEY